MSQELAAHLDGATLATFRRDKGLQRIAERLIEIAGEAASHVTADVAEAIEADWTSLRGMRVVLAHAYHRVDLDMLWAAATRDLPKLAASVSRHISHG